MTPQIYDLEILLSVQVPWFSGMAEGNLYSHFAAGIGGQTWMIASLGEQIGRTTGVAWKRP
jgi:hypothetical protein